MEPLNNDTKNNNAVINTFSLLPLRDIIVFPKMIVPLFIGRGRSIKAVDYAINTNKTIILAAQRVAKTNDPAKEDIYNIGTIADILQIIRLSDGTVKILVEGVSRCNILSYKDNNDFFLVEASYIRDDDDRKPSKNTEAEALMRSITGIFEKYVKLNQKMPDEAVQAILGYSDPSQFADSVAAHLIIKITDKQKILETIDPIKRMEQIYIFLESEIEILQVEKKVRGRVKKQVEKSQKEYYLNEQMKAIQKELGRPDDIKTEIDELTAKAKAANMPKEAYDKTISELKKLELMPPMSAEATVVRNYVDWMLAVPWSNRKDAKLNIDDAEKILDEDHYGLAQVKERIVEYLAVSTLVKKIKGPILCLVGPPGVGKTSLGKAIAKATGRDFVRMSLGGVRDEAEIRGHRRTYIGAMPGKIIQYMKKAGTKNPVFMLDEIDKMSTDFRGDPSSALLEVLDPEQNYAFNDHYLEVDYDLSEVMFITTANVLHSIPRPLKDRMEVLRIPGYTDLEKMKIGEIFLVPKKIKDNGLTEENLKIPNNLLNSIIKFYTREAGVRNLEREISTICRKVAKEVVKNKGEPLSITLNSKGLTKYLGMPQFRVHEAKDKSEIGVATGLAWTEVGGEMLTTEVNIMDGKGKLTLTGKLGEVMQESAQAALSYVRSRTKELGLQKNFYQKIDIHIHVPEGAIPKDGPSAGITMATALISALTNSPIRKDVAMTGEITLRGRILPIGGVKEKLLAAHRGHIKEVILPEENKNDLKEVPSVVKKALNLTFVSNMDEVIKKAIIIDKNNLASKKLGKMILQNSEIAKKGYTNTTIPTPDIIH